MKLKLFRLKALSKQRLGKVSNFERQKMIASGPEVLCFAFSIFSRLCSLEKCWEKNPLQFKAEL